MRILLLPLLAGCALAQLADYANSGYRTPEGRARVANSLSAHDREQTQRPRDLVAALGLKPGMTVADVGTGVGFMLPYLAEPVGAEGKVFAEDIFPDFLEKARANAKAKNLSTVAFIHGTEKDPKLPEDAVDVVLVLDVYHHFDFPADMLAGIHKSLKSGGRLVIVDFYKEGFRDPKHIRLDQVDVAKEIESNGFRLHSTGPFSEGRQYIAVFAKKAAK
ncbi:MAG: methyltransferase domain-containing protein [Acidobacteria bacterium]|nr:methyltransferase domain-containing protein [Acidobacteriota bacterium]